MSIEQQLAKALRPLIERIADQEAGADPAARNESMLACRDAIGEIANASIQLAGGIKIFDVQGRTKLRFLSAAGNGLFDVAANVLKPPATKSAKGKKGENA